jgi:hypothetical protein
VTSPMKPAQGLSNHNRVILTQMKTMACQMQTMASELDHLPKLGIWTTIQSLSGGVQEMLESDVTPRLR